jgi:hypothetical protein
VSLANELQDEVKSKNVQTEPLLSVNKISKVDEKVRCVDRRA